MAEAIKINNNNKTKKINKNKESFPDWINLIIVKSIALYSLGKLSFAESLFNTIVIPILETGGVEKESLEIVLEFLKNPTQTHDQLYNKIEQIKFKQEEQLDHLGKIGRISLMLTQALVKTALFTVYPGIGLTIGKLNLALSEMKKKIDELQSKHTTININKQLPSIKSPSIKGGTHSKKVNSVNLYLTLLS